MGSAWTTPARTWDLLGGAKQHMHGGPRDLGCLAAVHPGWDSSARHSTTPLYHVAAAVSRAASNTKALGHLKLPSAHSCTSFSTPGQPLPHTALEFDSCCRLRHVADFRLPCAGAYAPCLHARAHTRHDVEAPFNAMMPLSQALCPPTSTAPTWCSWTAWALVLAWAPPSPPRSAPSAAPSCASSSPPQAPRPLPPPPATRC